MDTDKYKTVTLPRDVYRELRDHAKRENRKISGMLRIVWESYKNHLGRTELSNPKLSKDIQSQALKYCLSMIQQIHNETNSTTSDSIFKNNSSASEVPPTYSSAINKKTELSADKVLSDEDLGRDHKIRLLLEENLMTQAALAEYFDISRQRVSQIYQENADQILPNDLIVKKVKRAVESLEFQINLENYKKEYNYLSHMDCIIPLVCFGPGKSVKVFSFAPEPEDHKCRKAAEELKMYQSRICFDRSEPIENDFVDAVLITTDEVGPETKKFCTNYDIQLITVI